MFARESEVTGIVLEKVMLESVVKSATPSDLEQFRIKVVRFGMLMICLGTPPVVLMNYLLEELNPVKLFLVLCVGLFALVALISRVDAMAFRLAPYGIFISYVSASVFEFYTSEGFKYTLLYTPVICIYNYITMPQAHARMATVLLFLSLLSAFYIIPEDAPIAARMVILTLMAWGLIDQLVSLYKRSITKIQQTNIELAKANRAKSDFLANVSHEIRTPLNGIFGSLQVIKAESSNPEAIERYTDVAMGSYRSVVGIVNDLLDLEKIVAGKFTIVPEAVSLSSLMQQLVSEFQPATQAKGLTLQLDIDKRLSNDIRLVDSKALSQVVRNLLSNAVKFTATGGVTISLSATDNGTGVTIRISDTGIGIPEDKLKLIFEPFEQVEASRSNERTGTGLGLAITSALVELMQGTVKVDSKPDFGTTFTLYLELPLTNLTPVSEPQSFEPCELRLPARILLVEDVATNRMLLRALLKDQPYEIDEAVDGVEGVNAAMNADYDLVLMDIQMPNMNGFEALKALQLLQYKAPVVACTANVMKEDIQAYVEAGFDAVIGKPYLKADLISLIQNTLSQTERAAH